MELTLNIQDGGELGAQLYRELRKAILDGRLAVGEKLPSSRELAERLCLSRNTVTTAYERLVSGGYLAARHGAGTYVSEHALERGHIRETDAAAVPIDLTRWARRLSYARAIVPTRQLPYDFRPGLPDLSRFPMDVWRRALARDLRTPSPELAHYGEPAGDPELRAGIARYVAHSRAVICSGDDVLITSGAQQALDILGRILIEPGVAVAVEDPGYPAAIAVFRAIGARIVPVPVDNDGLRVDLLPPEVRVIYVTPSHQFPLGVTLTMSRRRALLEWAAARRAVIIEDDYDSEFRFHGRPLESLQGVDHAGVVVYLGTFSKVLFPGLRLGYMVPPETLREPILAAKWLIDRHNPHAEQRAMSRFIGEGQFQKYMRRMQKVYAERQSVLIEALRRNAGAWLTLLPSFAGLHVTARLSPALDEAALLSRANATGVGLYSIRPFYLGRATPGLMFGYGGLPVDDIREGVDRLAAVMAGMAVQKRRGRTPPKAGGRAARAGPSSRRAAPRRDRADA